MFDFLPSLAHHTLRELLPFFAWGAVGALLAGCCKTGRLALPRMTIEKLKSGDVKRYLDLGFLSTTLFGGYLAAAIDGRPFTAALTGISVAYLGREVLKPLVELWLRKLPSLSVTLHSFPEAKPEVKPAEPLTGAS